MDEKVCRFLGIFCAFKWDLTYGWQFLLLLEQEEEKHSGFWVSIFWMQQAKNEPVQESVGTSEESSRENINQI